MSIILTNTLIHPGGSVTLNSADPSGKPNIDLGFFTTDFDIRAMIEGIKITQTFYKAPVFKNYIIEQMAPLANATDAELEDFIRNTAFSSQHAVGTAAMSAAHANYGVVNPDLRVKGASGLRIVDGSVMVRGPAYSTLTNTMRLTYLSLQAFHYQRAYTSTCIRYCRARLGSYQGDMEITICLMKSQRTSKISLY